MIFSSLPLIVSPFLLPAVFLFVPRSLLSPQMCTVSAQKRFPLFEDYNKQLFAMWNNKDCHHGYSSIPWALSGPFPSSQRSNYLMTSKTVDGIKKQSEGIGHELFIRQVETGSSLPCSAWMTGFSQHLKGLWGNYIDTVILLLTWISWKTIIQTHSCVFYIWRPGEEE